MFAGLFETNGVQMPGTMCDHQFYSSSSTPQEGRFYSPRYPSSYPKNIQCSYLFKARWILFFIFYFFRNFFYFVFGRKKIFVHPDLQPLEAFFCVLFCALKMTSRDTSEFSGFRVTTKLCQNFFFFCFYFFVIPIFIFIKLFKKNIYCYSYWQWIFLFFFI